MVETLLALFVLLLILFGMIHIFYFFTGQFYTDYAALRGARSRAVGFADYLVKREIRVNAIGASGKLIFPRMYSAGDGNKKYDATQFSQEKTLIQRYMVGASWLEYENWFGSKGLSPHLNVRINDSGVQSKAAVQFSDYAFPWSAYGKMEDQNGNPLPNQDSGIRRNPIRLFFGGINLDGSAAVGNHSKIYLED